MFQLFVMKKTDVILWRSFHFLNECYKMHMHLQKRLIYQDTQHHSFHFINSCVIDEAQLLLAMIFSNIPVLIMSSVHPKFSFFNVQSQLKLSTFKDTIVKNYKPMSLIHWGSLDVFLHHSAACTYAVESLPQRELRCTWWSPSSYGLGERIRRKEATRYLSQ